MLPGSLLPSENESLGTRLTVTCPTTRGFTLHFSHIHKSLVMGYGTYTSSTEPSTLRVLVTPDLRGSGSTMRELRATSASDPLSNGTRSSLMWRNYSSIIVVIEWGGGISYSAQLTIKQTSLGTRLCTQSPPPK